MNEEFDDIERLIIKEFEEFLSDVEIHGFSGDTTWTFQLKKRLAQLGDRLGYKVSVGGLGEDFAGEWMYDVVWFVEDEDGCLIKVPLIVESEWDKKYSGIKYDFEKLLIGNAERRLIICQAKGSEIENLFIKLENAIVKFQENKNDRFLIAVLNCNTDDEFHYRTFTKN
ncbi:hypothetical protein [Chryseobacterium sp. Leaf394]|uniref:hypothetical protein n=1 Tax=Chryseobacterium sp. Leaf394 TaxID=1736361 RepID=UPI0007001FC0|nr:hypothetical protein [Chryseobacterium sp. Leaf394]KQS91721.1 hypothetical protein ASG21_04465 [Chryseobacterium sp. Leaf394]